MASMASMGGAGGECTYSQMLEEPGAHHVGGHLWEDPSLLVVPLVAVQLVVIPPTGRRRTGVQTVA